MALIDAHVHLYPAEANRDPAGWAAARGERHWAVLCTRRRKDGRPVQGFSDVDGLLRAMDAAGVGRAVLQGWYWENPETAVLQNRLYARCLRAHPDRLAAFAALHPGGEAGTVRGEIHRWRDEGFAGLGELSPHSQGCALNAPGWRELLACAGEFGLPVNLHVTDPAAGRYPGRVETPLDDFKRLALEFPQTRFILAHWGGLLPLHDPAARALPNLFYDTAASPLLYDPSIWRRFVAAAGAERVLFGSDFPLNLYPKLQHEAEIARLVAEAGASGLTAAELAAIRHDNAVRLLGPGVRTG